MEEIYKARKKVEQSRKIELRIRVLKYTVMSIGTLALLTVALFYVSAYRFDVKNIDVRQTGLVKFASSPNGAKVYIDGELKNARTASEQVLDIGEHSVRYEMDGYRSWEKTFALSHGQVLWLDYVLMLPEVLQFDAAAEVGSDIKDMVVTRDKKRALIQYAGSARFALVTMSDPTRIDTEEFILSGGVVSVSEDGDEFEILEGDNWSKRFLIRHGFMVDGGWRYEYIVVNREDLDFPKNLTSDLVINAREVVFSEEKENQFYVIDMNDDLRLVDYDARSISAPITRGVMSFSQYKDKMAVISNNGKGEVTFGVLRSGKNYRAVKNFLVSDGELGGVDTGLNNYFNKDYVVVLARNQVSITSDPFNATSETLDLFMDDENALSVNNFKWVTVSENGQIILAGDEEFVYYYNLETKDEIFRAFMNGAGIARPKFIDKFKVLVGRKLLDVDGSNMYEVGEPIERVFLSSDKRYMFGLLGGEEASKIFVRVKIAP